MPVSYEDIATRAYYMHLDGGHDPLENWLRAEQELVRLGLARDREAG